MANNKIIEYDEATGKLKEIYAELIEKRGQLAEVHKIQSLNPETIVAHMDLYLSIMFSQSPLSRAQREMISVVVSAANRCEYCLVHHGVALNNYWKDESRVEQLKTNYQKASLNETDALLCQYAIDLTLIPDDFENNDKTTALKKAGLDDRSILDATLVIAYFNFVKRIVSSMGVTLEESAGEGYKY
jgi:uncharacterized peroxidase-related enzyme